MSIRRAVIFSSIDRYFGFVASFITTIIISRLLSPAEVGAFSVAMAVAGIGYSLREFGASAFIVRSPSVEPRHVSCAFGLTLAIGSSLGTLLLLLALPIAKFFNQDSIAGLIAVLSLNFFLLPFGSVQNALIQRAMKFDVIARINMLAVTVSVCTSITLAWLGHGAISLAWGSVALSATSASLSSLWGPKPRLVRPQLLGARELVTFGAQNTGLTVLSEIGSRYPEFILGKIQDFAAAGLMSRAQGLVNNVNDLLYKGMYPVALSYFSQIQRENGDPVQAHLKIATLVTGLGWPALVGLAMFAEPLTKVLYGDPWLGIVWPLRLVCLELAILMPFCFQYQVVMAMGGMAQQVRATTSSVVLRLAALTVGAHWGATGAAVALVAAQIGYLLLTRIMVWPAIRVTWPDYWKVIQNNLLIFGIAIASSSAALVAGHALSLSPVQHVLALAPMVATAILLGYVVLGHPLVFEARLLLGKIRNNNL